MYACTHTHTHTHTHRARNKGVIVFSSWDGHYKEEH